MFFEQEKDISLTSESHFFRKGGGGVCGGGEGAGEQHVQCEQVIFSVLFVL